LETSLKAQIEVANRPSPFQLSRRIVMADGENSDFVANAGLKSLKTLNLSLCHQFPLDGNKKLHEQLDQTMFNINTNPN
jgi:hypothetical protein